VGGGVSDTLLPSSGIISGAILVSFDSSSLLARSKF